jgi:hypothetical protein
MTRFPEFFNDPNRPCLGATAVFFRNGMGRHSTKCLAVAKDACATCPHQTPCRDWAVTTNELFGIWGGTTPHERRAIRRGAGPSIRGQVIALTTYIDGAA